MTGSSYRDVPLILTPAAMSWGIIPRFAEWEAIAKALTRARQYLCSLSINPDERQGRLTRAQYLDYIERAEVALGLTGQPRVIIFHEKQDDGGELREHCHVVWSRTDVKNKRAIPLAFFKEKLMAVTREFARDYGLRLPAGYERQDEPRRNRQLSAYDCVKQKETGMTHEQRMAAITDAWQRSDSAKAFVAALEDFGYVLARGRNATRIVLVDFYGHTTALTRLIDDASVRAKHVRAFLGAAYAPDKLPSVEQAQEQAAKRRAAIEAFEAAARGSDEAEQLARQQAERRVTAEAQAAALRRQQHDERVRLAATHKAEQRRLKASYLAVQRRIRIERARRRPRGLAAFLGRISGVAVITRKIQRYRDKKRYAAYLVWRNALKRRQKKAADALAVQQALQMADIQRSLRALDQIEQRERDSLRQARRRERRQRINVWHEHMPPAMPITPIAKESPVIPAQEAAFARLIGETARLLEQAPSPVRLSGAFARADASEDGDGESGGNTGTTEPSCKGRRRKSPRAPGTLSREFLKAASTRAEQGEGAAGGESADVPPPIVEPPRKRRRRRKRKARDDDPPNQDRRRERGHHDTTADNEAEGKLRKRRRDAKPDP